MLDAMAEEACIAETARIDGSPIEAHGRAGRGKGGPAGGPVEGAVADRGCDTGRLRAALRTRGTTPVIPLRRYRGRWIRHDERRQRRPPWWRPGAERRPRDRRRPPPRATISGVLRDTSGRSAEAPSRPACRRLRAGGRRPACRRSPRACSHRPDRRRGWRSRTSGRWRVVRRFRSRRRPPSGTRPSRPSARPCAAGTSCTSTYAVSGPAPWPRSGPLRTDSRQDASSPPPPTSQARPRIRSGIRWLPSGRKRGTDRVGAPAPPEARPASYRTHAVHFIDLDDGKQACSSPTGIGHHPLQLDEYGPDHRLAVGRSVASDPREPDCAWTKSSAAAA